MTIPLTYIDLHILQTLPPSNVNRDDAGSPKTAMYGGVQRSRVSSQAWKRATRVAFAERLPEQDVATRTKRIAGLVAERLVARTGLERQAAERVASFLPGATLDIKPGAREGDTAYLLFFGHAQLERIVDLVADDAAELAGLPDDALKQRITGHRDAVHKVLQTGHPVAVALFGRMVADIPALNVDAATQVAHAISTHAIRTEFDYFTAVDDENTEEETGAGMIGNVEFTSSTLYRYATIGLRQLVENLDEPDAVRQAVRLFTDCFVRAVPGGHQNTFAHRTLPHLVAVTIRDDQPVNLVGAFENPVRSQDGGHVPASARRLAKEALGVAEVWGAPPVESIAAYAVGADKDETAKTIAAAFGDSVPFPALLDRLDAVVAERLKDLS